MVYILETKLSESIPICQALQKVFGLGKKTSFHYCRQAGFSVNLKVSKLNQEQISKFLKIIEASAILLTSDLKKKNRSIIKRLVSIKSYRGLRRIKGLPVRGQRTHTNAKTSTKINT